MVVLIINGKVQYPAPDWPTEAADQRCPLSRCTSKFDPLEPGAPRSAHGPDPPLRPTTLPSESEMISSAAPSFYDLQARAPVRLDAFGASVTVFLRRGVDK
jgi:hypothetical protein